MIRYIPLIALATLLVSVFLAMPSAAAENNWIFGCNDDATNDLLAVPVVTALNPGERACAESITQTDATVSLYVQACNHVDIYQYDDADGDADLSTVVGTPQICPNGDDDDDSCSAFGLTVFAGDDYVQGLGAAWVRVLASGTTDTAPVRWEVRCVGRSGER